MHVLFLLEYFSPHLGGAETVFEHIITWLLAKWYTISLITAKFDKSLPDVEKKWELTIYRVWSSRINFMWHGFREGMFLLKKYPDIHCIYTTTYTAALPAGLLSFFFKKKCIITVHEIFWSLRIYSWWKGFFFKWYEELILRFLPFSLYHCVSWYTYNSLRVTYGIPDAKLSMIYNGVDHAFWNPDSLQPMIVAQLKKMYGLDGKFVGMYFWHSGKSKGVDSLLEALPHIVEKYPDFVIILDIIHAQRDKEIRKKIRTLKLKNNIIEFHGLLKKDLLHKVALADFVIVPSLSEGFWLVAAEVSSLGKPLLVSGVGALPEVVSGTVKRIRPWSVEDIIKGVEDIRQQKNLTYIPRKEFHWEQTIHQIDTMISRM